MKDQRPEYERLIAPIRPASHQGGGAEEDGQEQHPYFHPCPSRVIFQSTPVCAIG